MLRKLVSAIAIFTLATFGLSPASPAAAAGTFSPAVSFPSDIEPQLVVPGTDQFAIMFWTASESNVEYLKSAHLNLDGTVSDVTVIASGVRSSFAFSKESVVGDLSSGGIFATWVRSSYIPGSGSTPGSREFGVYSAFTDDGTTWSVPVEAYDSFSYSDNDECGFMQESFCAYGNLMAAQDSNGVLAISVIRYSRNGNLLKIKTSLDGSNWGSESVFTSGPSYVYLQKISALQEGGFIAFFSGTVNDVAFTFYSRSLSGRPGFWSAPTALIQGNFDDLTFAPAGAGKYSLLYFSNSDDTTNLYRKVFDSKTRTWSTQESLNTVSNSYLPYGIKLLASRGNRVSYLYAVGIFGSQQSKIFLVDIIDGVVKPAIQVAEPGDQQPNVFGFRVNADNTLSFAYSGQFQSPQLVSVSTLGVSTLTAIPLDMAVGNSVGAVSPSGNIFMQIKNWQANVSKTIAYVGAEAPVPAGPMRMTGKAKVAATLSTTVPTFASRTGVGATSIQWYSCRNKVAAIQWTVPAGCVAIAKAKATKFKVTTKQKNKYLAVAVTNTNAVGTTTMFSPTTAKTK
jgi:hypothetical protein